jgi:hypothetical protein
MAPLASYSTSWICELSCVLLSWGLQYNLAPGGKYAFWNTSSGRQPLYLGLFADLCGVLPNGFVAFIPIKESWFLEAVDVSNRPILRVQDGVCDVRKSSLLTGLLTPRKSIN